MCLSLNLSKAHSPWFYLWIHCQLYAIISVIEEECRIKISTPKWRRTIFLSFLILNTKVINMDWFEFILLSLAPFYPLSFPQAIAKTPWRVLMCGSWEKKSIKNCRQLFCFERTGGRILPSKTLSLCFGKPSCDRTWLFPPHPLVNLLSFLTVLWVTRVWPLQLESLW